MTKPPILKTREINALATPPLVDAGGRETCRSRAETDKRTRTGKPRRRGRAWTIEESPGYVLQPSYRQKRKCIVTMTTES